MKFLIMLFLVYSCNDVYGQKQPEKKGAFTAAVVHDIYKYDSISGQYYPVKVKRPYLRYYFNEKGQPLEKWHYGKYDVHHGKGYTDYTFVYTYNDEGLLAEEVWWQATKPKGFYIDRYKKYVYDKHNNETEIIFVKDEGNYVVKYAYQYDEKGNVATKIASDYRIENKYDINDRLIETKHYDISTGKLDSESNYIYNESTITQSWINNIEDNNTIPTLIIKTFTGSNDIETFEMKWSKSGILKKVCYYNKGVLESIEHFTYSPEHNDYLLSGRTTISVKGKPGKEALRSINKVITDELDLE